jgi:hypothetical protein
MAFGLNFRMNRGMNSGVDCVAAHEKIVLAAYNELPDDLAHALALHLNTCPACREEQQHVLALKTLASAAPVLELDPNLIARSRHRLDDLLDAIPPKRWYDRLGDWMTRTAVGLQSAPAAACLLLVAGAGLGSLVGFEFAQRHVVTSPQVIDTAKTTPSTGPVLATTASTVISPRDVASISGIVRQPNSNLVEVSYDQLEPRHVVGTLEDPQVRQLLMLASENGSSPSVRDNSVGLLADECRSGRGCKSAGVQGGNIRDALMVALRYDRSATVRLKALEGLQPYVAEDMQVRDSVLEALMNDPDARIRSASISMLEPVQADTSVRQVLSNVALSDQNSNIRNASRVVLQRVSEIQ